MFDELIKLSAFGPILGALALIKDNNPLQPIGDIIFLLLIITYGAIALVILGVAVVIMLIKNGDWASFGWYLINQVILGVAFFITYGIFANINADLALILAFAVTGALLFVWARRAGIGVAVFGALGAIGAAIGSSCGYESEGLLS